jgi:dienelactone hydrolase
MVTLAILGTVGFLWYARPMTLLPEATLALASTPSVAFAAGDDGRLTYTPITGAAPDIGLVFYPGALVPPAAYAPAALALAEAGFLVVVVPMPFNLAVFDIDAAAAVIRDHPKIETWAIAGHSLGGAMAAQFIDSHPGTMAGLALWAAYSAADLADDRVRVVNSYGTLDNGAPSFTAPGALALLGAEVVVDAIEGGNHEQMGWYTGQPGDPPASISRSAQQDRVVLATSDLLRELEAVTNPTP